MIVGALRCLIREVGGTIKNTAIKSLRWRWSRGICTGGTVHRSLVAEFGPRAWEANGYAFSQPDTMPPYSTLGHRPVKLQVSLFFSGRIKSIPYRTSEISCALFHNATFSVNQVKHATGKIGDWNERRIERSILNWRDLRTVHNTGCW